jgi:hypothetical protein
VIFLLGFFSFSFGFRMISGRFVNEFQIRNASGQTQIESIEHLDTLEDFIHRHGIDEIAKVSFYIKDTTKPGEFCNIILRNQDGIFVPEFCQANQEEDWDLVVQALNCGNLDEVFVPHIQGLVQENQVG